MPSLEKRIADIDDLAERLGAPASMRWDTIGTWLRHHPEVEPFAVQVRQDGRLTAAALLVRARRWGIWRVGKPGEQGEPYRLLAADEAGGRILAAAVRRELEATHRPWMLYLPDLPAPDRAADALTDRLRAARSEIAIAAPFMQFADGADLNTYLSRNVRSAAAKARNRAARDGLAVDLTWHRDPAGVESCLREMVEIHRERNEQLRGASAFTDRASLDTFTETTRAHAHAGRVRLLALRLDGSLAAFALCLVTGDLLWVYANYVSPRWLRYSAGTVANAEVVRAAFADPAIRCLDWGTGVQRYKLSGATSVRPARRVRAWSSRSLQLGQIATGVARRSAAAGPVIGARQARVR